MRDNVSIIFAAIFAVVLLIIFPLFSLLTRQDSIAYNKVLTLTTNFVDSVRTKGYMTEKEYTDYLVELANTNNTYKVEMECHKKILIKDVKNYTDDNPAWVEDTIVYYNKYVVSELESEGALSLDEGDELYVKVYNTNVTTASLLYSYFLGSRVPRKVVNIGYGGKVLSSSGDNFDKISFNASYTPYITFDEVVNEKGNDFKEYYHQTLGQYIVQKTVRKINVDDVNNNPIKVKFKLYNFATIGTKSINAITFGEKNEEGEEYIKEYVKERILEKLALRGDNVASYIKEVDDIKYANGVIEGTVYIKDIKLGSDVRESTAHIVISSNLGSASNGVGSSEGMTDELTLVRQDLSPNIAGPYLSQDLSKEPNEKTLYNKEAVFYHVTLNSAKSIKKLEIYDTKNSKVIASYENPSGEINNNSDYHINVEKIEGSETEFWIEVAPKYTIDVNNILDTIEEQMQIIVYADEEFNEKTVEVKSMSFVTTWSYLGVDVECESISSTTNYSSGNYISKSACVTFMLTGFDDETVGKAINNNWKAFFQKLADDKIIYASTAKSSNADVTDKLHITVKGASHTLGDSSYFVYYEIDLTGGPQQENVYMSFNNIKSKDKDESAVQTKDPVSYWLNVPAGFYGNDRYISDGATQEKSNLLFYWIQATTGMVDGTDAYYEDNVSEAKIKDSIARYGGYYIQLKAKGIETTFDNAWNEAVQLNQYSDLSDRFFGSLPYEWQAKQANDLHVGHFTVNDKLWIAKSGKLSYTVYTGGGTYDITKYNKEDTNKTARCWQVIYIK